MSNNLTVKEAMNVNCLVVLTKGKRKNEVCGKKIEDIVSGLCKIHFGKIKIYKKCEIVLTKGIRKNNVCNKKVLSGKICKMHQTLEDKKPYNPYWNYEFDVSIFTDYIENDKCTLLKAFMDEKFIKKAWAT